MMRMHAPGTVVAIALAFAVGGLTLAAAQTDTPLRTPGAGTPTGASMGEKMLTGTVASIDKVTGRLTLDVHGRRVELQFTPDAVADVEQGRRVTVMFGIRPETGATAVPGGATAPGP
jgi:hypothetical protein